MDAAFTQTVEYALTVLFWKTFDSVLAFGIVWSQIVKEEWCVHGTQQQDLLMVCFDNIRAPSRLLCEVLLNNLVI